LVGTSVLNEGAVQRLYPYQNFFSSPLAEAMNRSGRSMYNAGYISVSHRLAYGLSLQGSFTLSKAMDDIGLDTVSQNLSGNGVGTTQQNPYNYKDDWSLSPSDTPKKTTVGFTEEIPVGKNKLIPIKNRFADAVLSGWRFGSGINAQSGWPNGFVLGGQGWWTSLPTSSTVSTTLVNKGSGVPPGSSLRPDIVPGTSCYNSADWHASPTTIRYLNPGHFAVPGSLGNPRFGNAHRTLGECRSPSVFQMDANAGKTLTLSGAKRLYLGITATNVLNHPTWFSSGGSHTIYQSINSAYLTNQSANVPFLNATGFGYISTGNIQIRVIQLNAKFTF